MTAARRTEPQRRKARIFLVDDHPIVRERLAQLVNRERDMVACGEAEDVDQVLPGIREHRPDLVLLDLSLKDADGMVLIKEIREQFPSLPVLVLSMHDESLYAERVLRAGARGYITKQEATHKVMVAIRQVLGGAVYVSDKMSGLILQKMATGRMYADNSVLSVLSDRELAVFRRIGLGQSTVQIAEAFHLSRKTVESYRARIRNKLGISSPTHLLQQAMLWVQSGGRG